MSIPSWLWAYLRKPRGSWELAHIVDKEQEFSVLRTMPAGGMGIVLLVVDERLKRLAVWKSYLPGVKLGLERFEREISNLRAVSSPWVARIERHGSLKSQKKTPLLYYTMEYVRGRTLRSTLSTRLEHFPVGECLRIIEEICHGVNDLHRSGILHRDLKPENVMLDALRQYAVRLLDFGLSKQQGNVQQEVTCDGTVAGTKGYISPERILNPSLLSESVDIWAIGCIAYEVITGVRPFQSVSEELNKTPPPPSTLRSGLDPSFDTLIVELLNKEPERRVGTVLDVLRRVRALRSLQTKTSQWNDVALNALPANTVDDLGKLASISISIPNEWCQHAAGTVSGLTETLRFAVMLVSRLDQLCVHLAAFREHAMSPRSNEEHISRIGDDLRRMIRQLQHEYDFDSHCIGAIKDLRSQLSQMSVLLIKSKNLAEDSRVVLKKIVEVQEEIVQSHREAADQYLKLVVAT